MNIEGLFQGLHQSYIEKYLHNHYRRRSRIFYCSRNPFFSNIYKPKENYVETKAGNSADMYER